MSEYILQPACDRDPKPFDTKGQAQQAKDDHVDLCPDCTEDTCTIDDGTDEMEDVEVVQHNTQEAATDGGESDVVKEALDKEHAARTEWWAEETKRADKVRSEVLASIMTREDVQLVRRGTETSVDGVHELSFRVQVQGVPFEEYEVDDDG